VRSTARRLAILEAAFVPPSSPRPTQRPNLAVLTETDVAFMAGLQERIRQTGDYSQLTDDALAEAERILLRAGAE
jgi:hypothetical protein